MGGGALGDRLWVKELLVIVYWRSLWCRAMGGACVDTIFGQVDSEMVVLWSGSVWCCTHGLF